MQSGSNDARRLAARVAAGAEIRDVRLFKSNLELLEFESATGELRYSVDIDAQTNFEPGADRFVLRSTYSLSIDTVSGEGSTVARISFELAALFSLDDEAQAADLREEEIEAFAKSTGQMALWPFAREYVFDSTGRLGLPPLAIGVFRVPLDRSDVEAVSGDEVAPEVNSISE